MHRGSMPVDRLAAWLGIGAAIFGLAACGSDAGHVCSKWHSCHFVGDVALCANELSSRLTRDGLEACASCVDEHSCATLAACNDVCTSDAPR